MSRLYFPPEQTISSGGYTESEAKELTLALFKTNLLPVQEHPNDITFDKPSYPESSYKPDSQITIYNNSTKGPSGSIATIVLKPGKLYHIKVTNSAACNLWSNDSPILTIVKYSGQSSYNVFITPKGHRYMTPFDAGDYWFTFTYPCFNMTQNEFES